MKASIATADLPRHALHAIGEFDHLARLDVVEAVDARDAVADAEHLAGLADLGLVTEVADLAAEQFGVDRQVDGNVAADAGAQLLLEFADLFLGQRMRAGDLGRHFAAMAAGERAEGADDLRQRGEAAVFGEDAEEVLGRRVEAHRVGGGEHRLHRGAAGDQRAGGELGEVLAVA
ncbi:hypothetical protein WR25_21192 [Diploscapter pachys]|uniref:Uncharacterized protein n=1 Tax=Diploscapter pachys TaxID=2018661 RepID=A0A2A2KJN8_9BILA|nr:hypothetical protein WR25_21192 [Diploscapter pachys]